MEQKRLKNVCKDNTLTQSKNGLNVDEIKAHLRRLKLSPNGARKVLVRRLCDFFDKNVQSDRLLRPSKMNFNINTPKVLLPKKVRASKNSHRFRVTLRKMGMTQPYQDGTPREIWPDGHFEGYPRPSKPFVSDNRNGYRFNSMPLIYMSVRAGKHVTDQALFLIDSGATSYAKYSLYSKEKLLRIKTKKGVIKAHISNNPLDGQLDPSGRRKNTRWEREVLMGPREDRHGRPSPRENSVLGLPWIVDVRPLFEYENRPPPLAERLAIRFPLDGQKPFFIMHVHNPKNGRSVPVVFALDTGAPVSTVPQACISPLNASSRSQKRIFTWFEYETRYLYDLDILCQHETVVSNRNCGLTARTQEWGLLGMDFLLQTRPLIIYGDDDMEGQVRGVDYLEKNVLPTVERNSVLTVCDTDNEWITLSKKEKDVEYHVNGSLRMNNVSLLPSKNGRMRVKGTVGANGEKRHTRHFRVSDEDEKRVTNFFPL